MQQSEEERENPLMPRSRPRKTVATSSQVVTLMHAGSIAKVTHGNEHLVACSPTRTLSNTQNSQSVSLSQLY
jgi:hypothetical protein